MSASDVASSLVVVCDRAGAQAAQVQAFLESRGISEATWFAPRDMDHVDEAVRSGRVREVVFAAERDFLEALWSQAITCDAWLRADLKIGFAWSGDPREHEFSAALLQSWRGWQARRRRARIVSGLILSLVAVVAAFLVLLPAG